MEVHHSHHHGGHQTKKWKEYITEFLMLFTAVTLGFFAENQREHYIEHLREKQYMQSLYEDLKKDTIELNSLKRVYTKQMKIIDTTINLFKIGEWNDVNLNKIYVLNLSTLGNRGLNLMERTSVQLKNAGGMRLIKNSKISDEIANYWHWQEYAKAYGATTEELKLNARERSYNIFNQFYYNEINRDEIKTTKSGIQLMTYDKTILTEYANRLSHIKNSIKNQQLYQLDQILSSATILLNDLKTEYEVK
ncbi:MAG: hypothetical protein ACK4X2_10740 [Bacteroidota bacterium]|jgi:hypothetical protein